jgi:hypothetical protein
MTVTPEKELRWLLYELMDDCPACSPEDAFNVPSPRFGELVRLTR